MTQSETPAPTPSPPRAAPVALWRALRAFLAIVFDLFGPPAEIAKLGALTRKEHALLLSWLRAGEAFLRRLLFIEALALCGELHAAPAKPGAHKPRARRQASFQPDRAETWRVCFRVFASARTQRTGRSGFPRARIELAPAFCAERRHAALASAPALRVRQVDASPPFRSSLRFPNARPAAERLEAMQRAFNDPVPYARRLARALQRNGACAARVLAPQSDRLAQLFGAQGFNCCDALARRRWRRLAPAPPPDGR